jgi:cation diffusion facilitator CzcD-associated flavoprotein CzcO
MRTKLAAWPVGTDDFVPHHVLKDYIQKVSLDNGVDATTRYGTRVTELRKLRDSWNLTYSTRRKDSVTGHVQPAKAKEVPKGTCLVEESILNDC